MNTEKDSSTQEASSTALAGSAIGTCVNCNTRPATTWWVGDGGTLAFVHGGGVPWCNLCCVEAQIKYAKEMAARIPELEREAMLALRGESLNDVDQRTWREAQGKLLSKALQERDELRETLKAAYLKHNCDKGIGWSALSDKMCNTLCNVMGDKEFQRWLEEETDND